MAGSCEYRTIFARIQYQWRHPMAILRGCINGVQLWHLAAANYEAQMAQHVQLGHIYFVRTPCKLVSCHPHYSSYSQPQVLLAGRVLVSNKTERCRGASRAVQVGAAKVLQQDEAHLGLFLPPRHDGAVAAASGHRGTARRLVRSIMWQWRVGMQSRWHRRVRHPARCPRCYPGNGQRRTW